ncbi:MAG: glycosyltransferase family 4 protein [Bacteroidota bacterium]|nr:glycosyltransferase family 4 protein [Bacteroidota bacterium]
MKIAIYSGNIPSTTFIENLINGLAQAGFEIYLFGKQTKKVSYKGKVKIYPTPASDIKLILFVLTESLKLLFKNPKLFFKFFKIMHGKSKTLKTFIKETGVLIPIVNNEPDIFHIQWAKTVERYPEIFELLKSKIALSLRGAHINYSPLTDETLSNAYRKYFPYIDGFHAVSGAIGVEAMKYGADKEKIKVIHSSVKDALFQKKAKQYEPGQMLEIISIGRFHWKKGYHYALDAMKTLIKEGINLNYTIIAQGEIPEEIYFLIDEYNIKNNINIINGLDYDKLIEKLLSSHIFLLPSVEEGIANVVLEAMTAGVPVITTDCGGMSEVVDDRINGFIVPVRNPDKIINKVKEFLESDLNFRNNIAENAKKTIMKEFTKDKQVKEFSGFYKSLVN